jgi:glycosyltransferase involved in cell wall biosynthesis
MVIRLLSAELEADKTYEYRGHYISLRLLVEKGLASVVMLTTSTDQNADLNCLWNSIPVERTSGGRFITKVRYALRLLAPNINADIVIVRPWSHWHKALILARKLWGRPYIIWLDTYRYERQKHWRDFLYHEFRYGLLLRNADLIIGESPDVVDIIRKRLPKVRAIHIPIGLDIERLREIETSWRLQDTYPIRSNTVLYVGRISPEKRPHWAVEAFCTLAPQFPEWRLKIIGPITSPGGIANHSYVEQLINSINQSGCQDRIEFIPGLYGEDLLRQYGEASIVVLPSTMEGIPTTVIEAMYFGAAMLVTESGSVRWQLDDGKAGIIVNQQDREGFVAGLESLMKNVELRDQIALAGQQRVLNSFNWGINLLTEAVEFDTVVHDSLSHPGWVQKLHFKNFH